MKPIFASHRSRRWLDAELRADAAELYAEPSRSPALGEPERALAPKAVGLRYRPFERLGVRSR